MKRRTIRWLPGLLKLENIEQSTMKILDQYGFYLIIGGIPYTSPTSYEHIEPVYLGEAFKKPLKQTLTNVLKDLPSVQSYINNHSNMETLFICGIIQDEIDDETELQILKEQLLYQIQPKCNSGGGVFHPKLAINHEGSFGAVFTKI